MRCHDLASWSLTLTATVARNVKLHDARSWHLEEFCRFFSHQRKTPRRKVVAGFGVELATQVEVAMKLPLPTELLWATVRVRDSQSVERLAPYRQRKSII